MLSPSLKTFLLLFRLLFLLLYPGYKLTLGAILLTMHTNPYCHLGILTNIMGANGNTSVTAILASVLIESRCTIFSTIAIPMPVPAMKKANHALFPALVPHEPPIVPPAFHPRCSYWHSVQTPVCHQTFRVPRDLGRIPHNWPLDRRVVPRGIARLGIVRVHPDRGIRGRGLVVPIKVLVASRCSGKRAGVDSSNEVLEKQRSWRGIL